jgi:hypothetical protein
MSEKAHLGGHPDGAVTVPMPDEWTEPPAVVYVHKLSEAGRYLRDFPGVFGVPFRLVARDDGTPVVLPDGSVEYWHAPDAGPVRPGEEPTT